MSLVCFYDTGLLHTFIDFELPRFVMGEKKRDPEGESSIFHKQNTFLFLFTPAVITEANGAHLDDIGGKFPDLSMDRIAR